MATQGEIIEKRLRGMGVFVLLIGFVLIWRMFDLQIIKHEHYLVMAQGQQRFEKVEMAQRGRVFVHDSFVDPKSYYPLAFDIKSFDVWVIPKQVKDKEGLASELATILDMSKTEIFAQINNDKLYIPPVKKNLDFDMAAKVKEQNFAGVLVLPEYNRFYPEATLASQVLGFVNAEGDGKYGFEGHYNAELKGTAGNVTGEKDTLGRVINLLEQKDPQDGTSYVLTIDRSVQYFVEKKLAEAITKYQAQSGTVVIMDVETGGIVAMASNPLFDPNDFRQVAKENQNLFVNPAISHLFEPGSIFKPLVMAGAIDQGVINQDTKSTFDWHVWIDGYEIKTAERKAFGEENMSQVLQNSDNVAMVWISEQMGKDSLYNYLKKYNLFDKTGIDLDGEAIGYAPEFRWWKDINRATISFGQGITITPIEMVCAYAALANEGVYVYPHVVDKIIEPNGQERKVEKREGERIVKEETAKTIAEMLYSVVEEGHSWRAKVPGFKIGAKTGTAQISKPGGGYEESPDSLGVFIHSLAGFAPVDNPKYAMLVKLDRPKTDKYAESTAAPLFGEISSFLLNYYYRLQPNQ